MFIDAAEVMTPRNTHQGEKLLNASSKAEFQSARLFLSMFNLSSNTSIFRD